MLIKKKGIFLANDTYANMFLNLNFPKIRNISLPHTRLVGFDDSPIASEAILPITTVGQQIDLIAKTAMELLVRADGRAVKSEHPNHLREPIHKQITPVLDSPKNNKLIRHYSHFLTIRKKCMQPSGHMHFCIFLSSIPPALLPQYFWHGRKFFPGIPENQGIPLRLLCYTAGW